MIRRIERLAVGAALLVASGLAALSLSGGLRLPGEDAVFDLVQHAAGPVPPPADPAGRATVVLVDDESLARLQERWPLDRRTWARFFEVANRLGPAVVLTDAWFESPAPRDAADLATDLADGLREGPLADRPEARTLADALEKKASTLDADRRLASALAGGTRTVLGVACVPAGADTHAAEAPTGLVALDDAHPAGPLRCDRLTGSFASLGAAATSAASLNVEPDADGTVRHMPFFTAVGDAIYPGLALEACRLAAPEIDCVGRAAGADGGRPTLPFAAVANLQTVRFSDVLEAGEGEAPPSSALLSAFKGRAIFVGVSALGTRDLLRTSPAAGVPGQIPGVLLHAAAYEALRAERLVRADTAEARQLGVALLGLLAIVTLLTLPFGAWPALLGAALLGIGASFALAVWAFGRGAELRPMPTVVGFTLVAVVRLWFALRRSALARRQARTIRHAFQHYLAPAVVEALVRAPERLRLGGERLEITAFFSDVQGFTGISERLDPAQLIALLNDLLGGMTDCLLHEGGTIDKYIGDAIVAMFGAPLDQPDHAVRACRGALRSQRAVDAICARLVAAGQPAVNVRIGLNTGEALVGNMGSARRFDYTMIGDAVNLAARLEGINAFYGTRIMVGEATVARAGGELVFREVDAVRPKGKSQAVRIFELVGEAGAVEPAVLARLEAFARGLAAHRARDFGAAAAVFAPLAEQGDGPAAVFLERARAYAVSPPPVDWDTVHTLTSK